MCLKFMRKFLLSAAHLYSDTSFYAIAIDIAMLRHDFTINCCLRESFQFESIFRRDGREINVFQTIKPEIEYQQPPQIAISAFKIFPQQGKISSAERKELSPQQQVAENVYTLLFLWQISLSLLSHGNLSSH